MSSKSIAVVLVLVLVFGGFLVAVGRATGETGRTWTVTRTGGNPSSNAVIDSFAPSASGFWSVQVVSQSLQHLNVSVFTGDRSALLFFQNFLFGDHKPKTVSSVPFFVNGGSAYTLAFVPYGPKGGVATVTENFLPDMPPVASFTYSPAAPTAGTVVSFDASASYDPDGSIASYTWDFGDGGVLGTGVIVDHTFATAGTFTVTLFVVDNLGAVGSVSHMITVTSGADLPPVASFTVTPTSPIAGKAATFDASASMDPDGSIATYAWDFGDGSTETVVAPTTTHTYAAAGTFTVTLTVTDNAGLTGTATQQVSVVPDQPPVAAFSFSPASPSAGAPVTFDASASSDPDGTITAYAWDFGDGTTLSVSAPVTTHTFANAGTYQVSLDVTDDAGLHGTITHAVTVTAPNIPPVASFTFSPPSPNVGILVTFDGSASSDADGTITNYAWTFGDGGSASGPSATATHAYGAGGTYTVMLIVTDDGGATGSASQAVPVTDLPPVALFTFSPASPVALQTVHFDGTGSSDPDGTVVSFAWTFGDGGTATGATPSHAYAHAGTYTVTLTVTDSGGMTGSASQGLVVTDAPPVASFTVTPSSPAPGQSVTFDASASSDPDGTITTYAWDFGDGGTASGASATTTHTYVAAGTFTVTLTVTDDGGMTATYTQSVTVTSDLPPVASFTFSPASPSIGVTVTFDGSASNDPDGTITAYAWTFGDGASGSGSTATHAYAAAGTFTVTLTVTDNVGLTGSVSHPVTVADLPPIAAFSVTTAAPTATQPVAFDGSASHDPDGTITAYAWAFGDSQSTSGASPTTTHTYAHAGSYTVVLTVTDNGGLTGSVSHSVVVADAPPTAAFTWTPASPQGAQPVTFDGTGSSDPDGTIASYAWTFGDGGTATGSNPTHAFAHAGSYSVTLTVTDDGGMTNSVSHSVVVTDAPPIAAFTFSPPNPVALKLVSFDGSGSSDPDGTIASYAWTFGDGASGSGATATHTYAHAGTYAVTLTVTDDGGKTASVSHNVAVTDAPPIAAFTFSPASPVGAQPVTFDGTGSSDPDGTIASYAWTFGDGGTATGSNPTHAFAHAGSYSVTLTVTDDGGMTNSVSHSVVVTDAPPTAAFIWSPATPLKGTPVTLDATGSTDPDGTIATYAWTFGDGSTSTVTTPTTSHTYANGGTYTVSLTVTDDAGLSASTSHAITVVSDLPPIASFTLTRVLMTVNVDGSASSDPDGTVTGYAFAWGDGTTTTQTTPTATHTYGTAGPYMITLTVTDDGGMTGSVSHGTSVGPSTIDYTYYDFFNVPWGEWWDIRTNSNYGDEPVGASCFNKTSVADGTCTTNVAGIPRVAKYPYEDWSGPGSATSIYAPYRVKVAGLNVGGYSLSQPVFLPVFNYAAAPGTQLSFNWNMQYLDVANYTKYTTTRGCYAPSGANANDGYQLVTGVYVTLDNQEAARLFGAPATGTQTTIQNWWNTNTLPGCAMTTSGKSPQAGPLETSVDAWFQNEANGKYDIYNGYAGAYISLYTNITATVVTGGATGTTNVYLEHGAWGTEILLDRWFYWGNATYAGNQADSSKAKGWWGMENGWWEGVHYAGNLGTTTMNFTLSGVLQYHFQEHSGPGPDLQFRSATNPNDVDDVPFWTWGPQLVDYVASTNPHPYSEMDRYIGLNYIKTTPGSGDYGTNTSFDYTPISWNPKAGQTWHFTFPTQPWPYYANPATAVLGTNLPGTQLPAINSTLSFWKTFPASTGVWDNTASTWDVFGGGVVSWPDGSPGHYPYIPYGGIYFIPQGTNPGPASVADGSPAVSPAGLAPAALGGVPALLALVADVTAYAVASAPVSAVFVRRPT